MRAVRRVYGRRGEKVEAGQGVTMSLPSPGLPGQGVRDQAREQPGHQPHYPVRLVRMSGMGPVWGSGQVLKSEGLGAAQTGFSLLLAPPQVVSEEGTRYLSCSSGRSFRSVRERWWYIALSKCGVRGWASHLGLLLLAFLLTPCPPSPPPTPRLGLHTLHREMGCSWSTRWSSPMASPSGHGISRLMSLVSIRGPRSQDLCGTLEWGVC